MKQETLRVADDSPRVRRPSTVLVRLDQFVEVKFLGMRFNPSRIATVTVMTTIPVGPFGVKGRVILGKSEQLNANRHPDSERGVEFNIAELPVRTVGIDVLDNV